MERRRFLQTAGAVGAASMLPWSSSSLARTGFSRAALEEIVELTTLGRTLVKAKKVSEGSSGAYHRLRWGGGEGHMLRTDLAPAHPKKIESGDPHC